MLPEQLQLKKEIFSDIVIDEIEKIISEVMKTDYKMAYHDREFYRDSISTNAINVEFERTDKIFSPIHILQSKNIIVDSDNFVPKLVITYNIPSIVSASVGLLASIVGASASPFTAGCSAIAGLIALKGSIRKTNLAEGGIVFILATSSNHSKNRFDLRTSFNKICNKMDSVDTDDFNPALISLLNQGCIKVEGDEVILKEHVTLKLK
jgi:hypothetical protein